MRTFLIAVALRTSMTLASPAASQGPPCGYWTAAGCGWIGGDHKAPADPTGNIQGPHGDCRVCAVGDCGHLPCEPTEDDAELPRQLASGLRAENTALVNQVVVALDGIPSFNRDRGLIQVLGCAGGVIAQMPVPASLAADLFDGQ